MRARSVVLALGSAATVALAGCGESRGGGATATTIPRTVPRPGVPIVVVSLTDYRLEPSDPRVLGPGVITFDAMNDGGVEHALAITGPSGEVRTRALKPGEHARVRLELAPGTYGWRCPIANHERLGMVGRVRVGA